MKITLMRDKDGATTMRTLDINLQIEAMKRKPSRLLIYARAYVMHHRTTGWTKPRN